MREKIPKGAAPGLMKAGDKRVLVNGTPLRVDFRIVAEDYYQMMLSEIVSLETLLKAFTGTQPDTSHHTMD